MDNTQHITSYTNIRIKASPHGRLYTKFFRGRQIHLRSIIGRRCCIFVWQYPKQRIYLQIFLHDQGCVIFEWSQFMQFCSACTYPAFGGHSRLFSRQEEKATVDLLSSSLDGSLLRPRFTFLFLARQTGAFPFPLRPSYDKVLCGLYVAMYYSTFLLFIYLFILTADGFKPPLSNNPPHRQYRKMLPQQRWKQHKSPYFKPFSAHFRKWACIKDGF